MAIAERRVFYGKIGSGQELIKHLREGNEAMGRFGPTFNSRVLSDHDSGRSDRVVVEWESERAGDVHEAIDKAMQNPQAQAEFGPWIEKLNSLIHYAEVEHWHLH